MSDVTFVLDFKKNVLEILNFVKKLADYEKLSHQVVATKELLERYLFSKKKFAEVIFAKLDNKKIGFCLFFYNFSTSLAKPCVFIQNIYVDHNYRGQGIGEKFFEYLATFTKQKDCGRIEWSCINWNEESIEFYKSLVTKSMQDWTVFRLELLQTL